MPGRRPEEAGDLASIGGDLCSARADQVRPRRRFSGPVYGRRLAGPAQACRGLHGGEVTALGVIRPVRHLVVGVHQSAQDRIGVEHRPARRHVGRSHPIQPECAASDTNRAAGRPAAGEPVEADVCQQLIPIRGGYPQLQVFAQASGSASPYGDSYRLAGGVTRWRRTVTALAGPALMPR